MVCKGENEQAETLQRGILCCVDRYLKVHAGTTHVLTQQFPVFLGGVAFEVLIMMIVII